MTYHKKEALQANLDAVRTLLALENTRRAPSESDRATLRRYNGFGGLKCVLLPSENPADIDRWPRDERNLFPLVRELREIINQGASRAMPHAFGTASKAAYSLRFTPTNTSFGPSPRGLG